MSPEKEHELVTKYPTLFAGCDLPPTESLMCFGCECSDGWFGLLDALCASIDSHIKHNWKHEYPYQFTQIKEKFGGLRVYDTGHDDTIFGMICMAETMSHQICELCGHPARVCSSGYWLRTLCPACAEKHNYTCRIPEEEADA